MLRLFLTLMLVTMGPHFWQQPQNYNKEIRRKRCNKSPHIGLAEMAKFSIFSEIFDEICVF